MNARRRPILLLLAVFAAAVALVAGSASGASLGTLNSQLGANQARAQGLSASVGQVSGLISRLEGQIALVQSREAAVRAELGRDHAALTTTEHRLALERVRLSRLRTRLIAARTLLSRQLVSSYEGDRPDLVTVILNAHGFDDLLEQLDFLHRAEAQQQGLITVIRSAQAQARVAAARLGRLAGTERAQAATAALQARALAGMDSLLAGRQAALARLRAAQQAALASTQARGRALRSEISRVQAQQAAAARAAAAAAASAPSPAAAGPALGPSGGWAIPYAIVLCESGGQNLPPNSAGASGYYQILPSTWSLYGGAGPAAYLTSKSEQDAVASRIWAGGSGASQWVCAGIVGIH